MSLQGNAVARQKLQGSVHILTTEVINAYEIAVRNGFEGTEQEWLASLEGPQGPPGKDGKDGKDGSDGVDGAAPVKGKDYFTEDDKAEVADIVRAKVPVSVGEDTYTDIYGLRQSTEFNVQKVLDSIHITETLQGGKVVEHHIYLDADSKRPYKIKADDISANVVWSGF